MNNRFAPPKPLPPPPPPPRPIISDLDSSDDNTTRPQTPYILERKKKNKRKTQSPQKDVDEFWSKFHNKYPGKAYTLLPGNLYAKRQAAAKARAADISGARSENAQASYEEAVAVCKAKVEKIVEQCRRVNQKYTDSHFDLEMDFAEARDDCLKRLYELSSKYQPGSVKRIREIFDRPKFFASATPANDIRQGNDGNCWFLAAVCAILHDKNAIDKICVAKDEAVGVYGFVFYRDGEWYSEVIDDKLYLTKGDWSNLKKDERDNWNDLTRDNAEKDWREQMQKGSGALYFAQCKDQQETWLPLLEKAYAKAHGDYSSLDGGHMGEAIEDLTGGVTSEISTSDVLDIDKFWNDEMLKVNDEFFFGCTAGMLSSGFATRGIQYRHAYSIMETREVDGKRLIKLRNPWGKVEWEGPWSDGSEEWTPEWMIKLNHRFGDDGIFWIAYEDFLREFTNLDRTRRFGSEWRQTQIWTSLSIPWSVDYLDTSFKLKVAKKTSIVIVLSQLDDRFWFGLGGQYVFLLQFRLHKKGQVDYIVRSRNNYHMRRSVNAELEDVEPGEYSVRMKIVAKRSVIMTNVEEVLPVAARIKRDKFLKVGLQYDLAHAKGQFREAETAKTEREKSKEEEDRKATKEKQKQFHRRVKLRLRRREETDARRKAKEEIRQEMRHGSMSGFPLSTLGTPYDRGTSQAPRSPTERSMKNLAAFESAPEDKEPVAEATKSEATSETSKSGSDVVESVKGTDKEPEKVLSLTQEKAIAVDVAQKKAQMETPVETPHETSTPISDKDEVDSKSATPEVNGDTGKNSPRRASFATEATSTSAQAASAEPKEDGTETPKPPLPSRRSTGGAFPRFPLAPMKRITLSDISDSDVSWDSDEDGHFLPDAPLGPPPPPPPEDAPKPPPPPPPPAPPGPGGKGGRKKKEGDDDSEIEDYEADPWNAVVVVGLRVYSKDTAPEDIQLEVTQSGPDEEKKLDLDDAAHDATHEVEKDGAQQGAKAEGEVEEKKVEQSPTGGEAREASGGVNGDVVALAGSRSGEPEYMEQSTQG